MFTNKYPFFQTTLNVISENNNKEKLFELLDSVTDNTCNILFVTDYEVTTKVSQYYLNKDTPLSKNSNTVSIHSYYASYVYYITVYCLIASNITQCYSHGEFNLDFDSMYELIFEIKTILDTIIHTNKLVQPYDEIKQIIKEQLDGTFDNNKYKYLFAHEDQEQEDQEENNNIINSTFRDSGSNNGLEQNLEQINDSFDEKELSKLKNKDIYLFSDSRTNTPIGGNTPRFESESDEYINDIKEQIVNRVS